MYVWYQIEGFIVARQNFNLTEPNERWLNKQVNAGEFANKTEAINVLVREARKNDELIARLDARRREGFTAMSKSEILDWIKDELRAEGEL